MSENTWEAGHAWWRSLDAGQRGVFIQALYETHGYPPLGQSGGPLTDTPTWERGYRGFGLWLNGERIGVVYLSRHMGRYAWYTWEAAGRQGEVLTPGYAKQLVEQAIRDATP